MNPEREARGEKLAANVVVIGGGGAGLVAAVAAAEKGARVTVLEARRVPGGNAVNAIGLFAVIGDKGTDINAQRDDYFKKTMGYAHWRINARVVRALINKSGDLVPWLEAKGLKPERTDFFGPVHASVVLRCGTIPEGIGYEVAKAMVKTCEELGVRFLYRTRAKKLIVGREGRVTGVMAVAKGKELIVDAGSVIIATGGFVGNQRLLKKFLPPYHDDDDIFLGGLPHKGDGLLMATEIGAATEIIAAPEMSVNRFPWSSCLFIIIKHPGTIWVNKNGERFTDESVHEAANSQYRQPGKTSYTLIDEKIKEAIFQSDLSPIDDTILKANMTLDVIEEKIRQSIRKEGLFVGSSPWQTIAEKDLHFQADRGRVKISSSWEEIAQWMGADPVALKGTIDKYNAACSQGHDDIFAKDRKYLLPLRTPPYYAIRCYLNLMVTHGGIKINHNMEVLDKRDSPIPGLYAAGVEAASADLETYNPGLPAHGYGFAVNSGRIAGESAAEFASGKQDKY
ncbi:MAG: hypothetical protein A2144_02380 [Chloroflexi bacterium RBG_16_50_9]|nr:MAG: hypothetical protein A2144_02380 [Chloroflexi bacterium RBG_16_50_9]